MGWGQQRCCLVLEAMGLPPTWVQALPSPGCLYWPVRNTESVASQPMRKLQSQSGDKGSSGWQVRGGFQSQGWPAAQAVGRWQGGNRCAAHGPCRKPGRGKKGRPCLQPEFEELLSPGATPSAVMRALEGLWDPLNSQTTCWSVGTLGGHARTLSPLQPCGLVHPPPGFQALLPPLWPVVLSIAVVGSSGILGCAYKILWLCSLRI